MAPSLIPGQAAYFPTRQQRGMQGLLAHLWKIAQITEVGMSFIVT